jgi:hypothetical protein
MPAVQAGPHGPDPHVGPMKIENLRRSESRRTLWMLPILIGIALLMMLPTGPVVTGRGLLTPRSPSN